MSHMWMSHTQTSEWVMRQIRMSRATHINESVTEICVPGGCCTAMAVRFEIVSHHTSEWIMSHTWMSYATHTHTHKPCHSHEWGISHLQIKHVTRTCHVTHICHVTHTCHITHICEPSGCCTVIALRFGFVNCDSMKSEPICGIVSKGSGFRVSDVEIKV